MNVHNPAHIPLLVLGECPAPDMDLWEARLRIPCALMRVPREEELQGALDAALAQSDTLLLLGGFHGEGLPPLALLPELLAQSLLTEESQLAVRLIGPPEAETGAALHAKGVHVYACGAAASCQEEVLEEIQEHIKPEPAQQPENPWTPISRPAKSAPKAIAAPPAPAARRSPPARSRPVLQKPKSNRPLVTILIAACLAFCVGAGYLAYYIADTGLQNARAREIQALSPTNSDTQDTRGEDGALRAFAALRAANSDCVGWLRIPGAGVDLPVMLGPDDAYYLTHDAQRNKSRFGALFLDSENEVTRGRQSANLSIFGHNIKNGSMFGQLHRYRDLDFYRNNAMIQFDTLYTRRQWVVFAVFITNADPPQDYGYVFEWREQSAAAPENIMAFARALKKRSIIDTGVDVQPGDKLLSLTTCAYEIKGGRLVVFARALRIGETPPDPLRARVNPAPLYPAAWYVNYGGEKPE